MNLKQLSSFLIIAVLIGGIIPVSLQSVLADESSRIFTGTVKPSNSLGANGDLYINTLTGDYYQKQSNVWVLKGNLRGPAGPTGATGPQGNIGATGPQGPKGNIGATGPQGNIGATGPQGNIGATGPQGNIGATGPQGPKGDNGNSVHIPQSIDPDKFLASDCPLSGSGQVFTLIDATGATIAGSRVVICDGATGPQGPKGDTGPDGPQGPPGTITTQSCEAGQYVTGVDSSGSLICGSSSTSTLTTITLTSSANPSIQSNTVTFTGTLSSPTASGFVIFSVDGIPQSTVAVSAGQAQFSTNSLSRGIHTVSGQYTGDSTHGTSTATITQAIQFQSSFTTFTTSSSTISTGQHVTLNAIVNTGGAGNGFVTFHDSFTGLTQVAGVTNFSTASLDTTVSGLGVHTFTASYSGDDITAPSLSPFFVSISVTP